VADPIPRSASSAHLAQAVAWHRQVTAMATAADRAGVAGAELPALRQHLSAQAGRLTQAATQLGAALPALVPTPAEVAAAGQSLGDLSPSAIAAAVSTMHATLAAVDSALDPDVGTASAAALQYPVIAPPHPAVVAPLVAPLVAQPPAPGVAQLPGPAGTPGAPAQGLSRLGRYGVGPRNAAVYGAYSAVVIAVQVVLFLLLDEVRLPAAAPVCLLVLPALAWLAGYVTISAAFPAPPGQSPNRTPRLGVLVCLLPNALLVAAVVVLLALNGAA
jgi:hypothetical protein